MDILLQIATYNIWGIIIGLIAFLICGFFKLFFVKKINLRYKVAELKATMDAITDTLSTAYIVAADVYDKAKNKATSDIKKYCNAIAAVVGILLLIPFYIFILSDLAFYLNIGFWTNVIAVPAIAALFYLFYQGLQNKNISLKTWLHGFWHLVVALFEYLKNLKNAKDKSNVSDADLKEKFINMFTTLSTEEKEKIKNNLNK